MFMDNLRFLFKKHKDKIFGEYWYWFIPILAYPYFLKLTNNFWVRAHNSLTDNYYWNAVFSPYIFGADIYKEFITSFYPVLVCVFISLVAKFYLKIPIRHTVFIIFSVYSLEIIATFLLGITTEMFVATEDRLQLVIWLTVPLIMSFLITKPFQLETIKKVKMAIIVYITLFIISSIFLYLNFWFNT